MLSGNCKKVNKFVTSDNIPCNRGYFPAQVSKKETNALVSPELNPEVFEEFNIGVTLSSLYELAIIDSMEQLITVVSEQMDTVSKELEFANVVYGHEQLVKYIL